ncbi:MAG: TolC family protein [Bacteroidales bacterium]|jgi:outer membrane protein TolC|nr:TolC family protein [Bacteroidales bacterium]
MKKYIGLFIFLLIVGAGWAQEAYDLQKCLKVGLEQNYAIRIVRNLEEISDNNATLGNAGYLPTLDLSGGYSGTWDNNTSQKFPDGTENKYNNVHNRSANVGLNLGWTIFEGLKIQTNNRRLKELQEMGALETRTTMENFISNLVAEYYNYVRQNIRLKNLKAAVALSGERLRIVEARYNIGSMSRLDLQQARVDFNADSSLLIRQMEELNASRIRLNELMALENVAQKTVVSDTSIEVNMFLQEEDCWKKTLEVNSSLLISEKNKTLSDLDYKTVRSRNFPYLKMNAGYGYAWNHYDIGTYQSQQNLGLNYGLTLGFTVFDGMNRRREQRNAKIAIENSSLEYAQLELAISADFSNIWMAYQNNLDLLGLERENLIVAKENYEIALERYKLGDLSGIELREAQNSLLSAEERLLQAEYNTKLCEISLMQLSGQVFSYLEE